MDEQNTLDFALSGATDKPGDTYVKGRDDKKIKKQSDQTKAAGKQKPGGKGPDPKYLPKGAVGYKHGWIPVDSSGKPVGPAQKPAWLKADEAKHKAAGGLTVQGYQKQAIQKRAAAAQKAEAAKKAAAAKKIATAQKHAQTQKNVAAHKAQKAAAAKKKFEDGSSASGVVSDGNGNWHRKDGTGIQRDKNGNWVNVHKDGSVTPVADGKGTTPAVAQKQHQQQVANDLVTRDPSGLSTEALAAAFTEAKKKLADSGYSPEAQKVVDKIKAEMDARSSAPAQQAVDHQAATQHVAKAMHSQQQNEAQSTRDQAKAEAQQKAQAATPQAKRTEVAKQKALPNSAAARSLAKLTPEQRKKVVKARAAARHAQVLKNRAAKAAEKEKKRLANASTVVKQKSIKQFSNFVTNDPGVVLDFSRTDHKGQLAFRYKHGWILINPGIPSRGHHGGGVAARFHHKSGTVTKGHFVNNKFIAESTGHPSLMQELKTKQAIGKEAKALKAETEHVKSLVAKEHADNLSAVAEASTAVLDHHPDGSMQKVAAHRAAYEAHVKAQTAQADVGNTVQAAKHSDAALVQQKAAHDQADKVNAKKLATAEATGLAVGAYGEAYDMPEHTLGDKQAKAKAMLEAHQKLTKLMDEHQLPDGPLHLVQAKADQTKMIAEDLNTKIHAELKKAKEAGPPIKIKEVAFHSTDPKAKADSLHTVPFSVQKKNSAGEVTTVPMPGKAIPSGKLVIHKSPDKPSKYVISNPDGIKLGSAEFTTQKAAKEAALAVEQHYPGKSFSKEDFTAAKNDHAEAFQEFKDWFGKATQSGNWSGEPKKATPEAPSAPEKWSPQKNKAVLDAINEVDQSAFDKLSMKDWKEYFSNSYDVTLATQNQDKEGMSKSVEKMLAGPNPILAGVPSSEVIKANQAMEHIIKGVAPDAPKVPTDAPDIVLPGPGMAADGSAIKQAIENWKSAMDNGASDAQIGAMHGKIMKAKEAFKAKHGKDYNPHEVGKSTVTQPFVPQVPFFDDAKASGYHHPDYSEDLTGGWKPPKGTTSALGSYTGSGYISINNTLRKGKGVKPYSNDYGSNNDAELKKIAAMDKAFDSAPGLKQPTVTVRKLKDNGPFPSAPPPMTAGAEFIDYGYGSTSKSTTAWSGGVTMEVRMPAGTKVVDVNHNGVGSSSSSEQEVILDRGARYRVILDEPGKTTDFGTQRRIVVEVIDTRNEG